MKIKSLAILVFLLLAVFITSVLLANHGVHTALGSDNRGYVTKDVYSHYGDEKIKIAVVTGIHPREEVSIVPVQWATKFFALFSPVEMINYNIVVENNPQDYNIGRKSGEGLAATYILPDIKKSDYNLVIIAHAHEEGYGEGFYVATPLMDSASVYIAEQLKSRSSDFNYYPVSKNAKYKSSSARLFSRPLAAAGYPTLVYEIPEWSNPIEAYQKTYKLISVCYEILDT